MKSTLLILSSILFLQFASGQIKNKAEILYKSVIQRLEKDTLLMDSILIQNCITDLTNAIKIKSNFLKAYKKRAELYFAVKSYDKAVEDITFSIKSNQKTAMRVELYKTIAMMLYEDKNYPKAIEKWTYVLTNSKSPDKGFNLLYRAKAYWLNGQLQLACEDFKNATKIDESLRELKEFIDCK
jgi:tetratricopeptide (TPR) repeat protein